MTTTDTTWRIKMLYDGKCPICAAEVAILRRRDARGLIAFEDITTAGFNPGSYGLTMRQLIGSMHGVRSDGTVFNGIDVFAEAYDAIGWTWISSFIRGRLTRPLARIGYQMFAAVRPWLSGFNPAACDSGSCGCVTKV